MTNTLLLKVLVDERKRVSERALDLTNEIMAIEDQIRKEKAAKVHKVGLWTVKDGTYSYESCNGFIRVTWNSLKQAFMILEKPVVMPESLPTIPLCQWKGVNVHLLKAFSTWYTQVNPKNWTLE